MSMDLDDNALRDLALRLRTGPIQHLDARELRATLAWVSGREGHAGSGLTRMLGSADAEADRLWQIYQQLDRLLFAQDRLREDAAGLDGDPAQRLGQYRRLLAAFHPDRSPDLAAWLTPRFQAVQRAYTQFREAPGQAAEPIQRPRRARPRAPAGARRRHRGVHFGPGLKVLLQNRLGTIRHPEAKALGLALILALLGVLHVYLTYAPDRWTVAQELQARQDPDQGADAVGGRAGGAGVKAVAAVMPAAAERPVNGTAPRVEEIADGDALEAVMHVIGGYQHAFEQGDIEVLMRLLSAHPRENRNQGREWFRLTYTRVFSRSDLRELSIDIVQAEPDGEAWILSGQFDLAVHYPGGRRVQASGPIRYRIIQKNQEWLIAGIDY